MVKLTLVASNLTRVDIGELTLWFSYETIVAFMFKGDFHISENVWSNTTGKHLNYIDPNKDIRENHDIFEGNLAAIDDMFAKEENNE